MSEQALFKSGDMGTVAILRYEGFEAQTVEVDGAYKCKWVFFATEGLLTLVDEYLAGNVLVEPKSYNAEFAAVKRELHGAT